jgi:hypothetical protein
MMQTNAYVAQINSGADKQRHYVHASFRDITIIFIIFREAFSMISTIASTAFLNLSDPQASGILIGDIFGFILALPASLFLAFWMSAVKSKWAVILGALLGTVIGFLIILGFVGTLINDKPMPGVTGGPVFFGSVLFCSAIGLIGGILADLLVDGAKKQNYGRQTAHESH